MRDRRRWSVGLGVALTLAFGGTACGGDDGNVAARSAATTQPTSAVRADDSPSVQGGGRVPKSQTLDLEQRHPNGSTLRVTGVSFTATSVSVSIEAINGFTKDVNLNERGLHLRDELGNRYNFVEPPDNPKLVVRPGATLSGTLSFLGPIDRRATTLRLLVNVYRTDTDVDMSDEYDRTEQPRFQIDNIPVRR